MRTVLCLATLFWPLLIDRAFSATLDFGHGFADHGVATPESMSRGTVATVDGQRHPIILSWLMDHRECYELLWIDVLTGKAEEFPLPFLLGDSPFASLLSRNNRLYSHVGSYFLEFDPCRRAFTFCRKTAPYMAMGVTEDDHGVIWSATYPQCGVVSFNPKSRELHDYGHVYKQDWPIYPRAVAVDDAGWVYVGWASPRPKSLALDFVDPHRRDAALGRSGTHTCICRSVRSSTANSSDLSPTGKKKWLPLSVAGRLAWSRGRGARPGNHDTDQPEGTTRQAADHAATARQKGITVHGPPITALTHGCFADLVPRMAGDGLCDHETNRRICVIKKERASQPYRWGLIMRRTSFHKTGLSLFVVLVAVESAALAQTVPTRRQHYTYPQQTVSVALAPTAATSSANSQLVQALKSARTLLATANHDYNGHRASAAQEVRMAMAALGYRPKKAQAISTVNPGAAAGQAAIRKTQANSDAQLGQAQQILQGVLAQTGARPSQGSRPPQGGDRPHQRSALGQVARGVGCFPGAGGMERVAENRPHRLVRSSHLGKRLGDMGIEYMCGCSQRSATRTQDAPSYREAVSPSRSMRR